MASQADILAAFDALAPLDKKPNVKDVEELVGEDVSAAERDEAWDTYNVTLTASDAVPVVTNRYSSRIAVAGVQIAPGESAEVPGFDPAHAVLSRWLEAGVITVD